MDDEAKKYIEDMLTEKDYLQRHRIAFRNKEQAEAERYKRLIKYGQKGEEMTEKQYSKGIYIKKFTGQYGEWLSVSIKDGETYKNYKFYPKKEQKNDKYIEFYGVVDDWQPEKKQEEENIVKFNDNNQSEIPF